MRSARVGLIMFGVGSCLWGLWLMRDFTTDQLVSTGIWLGGGILIHDALLAPLTIGLGLAAARLLPGHFRAVSGMVFLVWATITISLIPVLSGEGGKPDNPTILNRPYVTSWCIVTVVLLGVVVVAARRRRRHTMRTVGHPPEP